MEKFARQLEQMIAEMKPGEALKYSKRSIQELFPAPSLNASIDQLLSRCTGSAYGVVRILQGVEDFIVISKHEEDPHADQSGFVYHVDPDRQHLYIRVPGGWRRRAVL